MDGCKREIKIPNKLWNVVVAYIRRRSLVREYCQNDVENTEMRVRACVIFKCYSDVLCMVCLDFSMRGMIGDVGCDCLAIECKYWFRLAIDVRRICTKHSSNDQRHVALLEDYIAGVLNHGSD